MEVDTSHELRVEVPCLPAASPRTLQPLSGGPAADDVWELPTASTGTGTFLHPSSVDQPADRSVSWTFSEVEPTVVTLLEASLSSDLTENSVRVVFPTSAYPAAAFSATSEGGLALYFLTADAVLHRLQIPAPPAQGTAALSALRSNSQAFISLPLDGAADDISAPTTLVKFGSLLALGTATGDVLCVPEQCLSSGAMEGVFTLRAAGSGVWRLFSRSTSPAVVDLGVIVAAGQPLLAAVYADAQLRVWDPARRLIVFTGSLLPEGSGLAPCRARFVGGGAGAEPIGLAVLYEAEGGTQVAAYQLDPQPRPDGRLDFALHCSPPVQGPTGAALDFVVHESSEEGLQAWLLSGEGRLVSLDLEDGATQGHACMLEDAGLADLLADDDLQDQDDTLRALRSALTGQDSSTAAASTSAVHSFAELLTSPGLASAAVLQETLHQFGHKASLEELEAVSLTEAQARVTSTVQAQAAQLGAGEMARWQQLLRTYIETWARHHPPLGLLLHPQTQVLGLLRSGGVLTAVREATPAESLAQGELPTQYSDEPDVQKVAQAAGAVSGVVGAWVMRWLQGLALQGVDMHTMAVPQLVRLLTVGPNPGAAQPLSQQARQRHSDWRLQRRRLALRLGGLFESMADPLEALRTYAALLADFGGTNAPPQTAAGTSGTAGNALVAALRQAASQQAAAALQLLLLLAYLDAVRDLGTWRFTIQQVAVLQGELIPQVHRQLLSAAVLQWATTTEVSQSAVSGANGDPAAMMDRLRLVMTLPTGSKQDAAAPQHQQLAGPQQQLTVAHCFLQDFASQHGGVSLVGGLTGWVARFAGYLTFRPGAGTPGQAPAPPDERGLRLQLLATAAKLFDGKQLAQLLQLVGLAGHLAQDPALLLIKGYSLAEQVREAGGGAERQRAAAAAAGPLFAAAAALRIGAAADASDSAVMCRQMLQQLLLDTTGSHTDEGPQALELQYYEALMLLFERLGAPTVAARFAAAAVRQLGVAFGEDGSMTEERRVREGRLWDNCFEYALDAGEFQEAHAAMQSNPVAERKLDCLQRLLQTLCARNLVPALIALPYAGTTSLNRDGRMVTVSLVAEAVAVLERRAQRLDLAARPQPYQLLYAFHVSRSSYRAAAGAMLAYARRLRAEAADAPGVLDGIEQALGAALNALSLVPTQQAWLEDPAAAASNMSLGPAPQRLTYRPAPTASTDASDTGADAASTSYEGLDAGLREAGSGYVGLSGLRREHAVARAHALAATLTPGALRGTAAAADIFQQLLTLGLFDAALALAQSVGAGEALTRMLQQAFAQMAGACVRAQLAEDPALRASAPPPPFDAPSRASGSADAGRVWDGDARTQWRRLQRYLLRFDSPRHGYRLRLTVVETILATERRMQLPPWLLQPYQVGEGAARGMDGAGPDPAALLRALLRHGRLQEGAALALRYLRHWDGRLSDLERQRPAASWFPYGLLDALLDRLGEQSPRSEALKRCKDELEAAAAGHRQLAVRQTELLEQS